MRAIRVEAGLLVLIALGFLMLELGAVAASGFGGLLALILALSPVPLLFALGLWIDRFEPEPVWLLMRTFLWGAAVAIMAAGIVNTFVAVAAGPFVAAVGSAPIIEEAMKGLAVLWVFRNRTQHMHGVLDGIVYSLFVGLGFAVIENIQYYQAGFDEAGAAGLVGTVALRGLLTPFLHPFFTMFVGIGLGLAVRRQGAARWLLPVGGYLVAVFLHALWNSGIGMALYPVLFVPAFIWTVRRVLKHRREEAELLVSELEPEVEAGLITAHELEQLRSRGVTLREYAAALGNSEHPLHAWRELHHMAFGLASYRRWLRSKLESGQPPSADEEALHNHLRERIWQLRHAPAVQPQS